MVQSEIMKVVNLKQAILQAWKERWSDYQWAVNMKKFFPKGATWDILNLAEALLEQAMIGPSPNPLILSYLKYAISSQMVSYSSVLTAISKFDDFSRDLCVQALLDIMDMFCDRLSCHGKAEECIGLCRALLSALHWLLRCTAASAERLREGLEAGTPAAGEKQLAMCLQRLEKTLSSTKNRALLHIAKLEEASSWTAIEHCLLKLGEILANLSNHQLRSQAEQCGTLIRSIPTMLSVHSEQLHKTGFPTVHAVVLLEGTMNLTGETQPLVEQLMMVKRMQVGGRGGFSVPTASWPWRAGGRSLLVFPGRYRVSPALWQIMDPHRGGSVRWNGSAISPAVPGSRSGVREVSMLPGSDLPDPQGSGDWSGMGTLFFLTLGSSHSISFSLPASWTAIEHCLLKLGDPGQSQQPPAPGQAEQCGTLIRRYPCLR
uniref:Mediator of RNA polymerase II transcription subunit 24 n=1 Tax=Bos mutus grunniens TaxID=30521 RepID=A0A8C0AHS9_BOSMU